MVSLAVLLSHWGFVIRDFGPTFAVWAPRLWIHLPEETESRRSSNFFTIIIVISFHLVIPFCSQPVYNSSCDVLILPSFTAFICLFILIYLSDFTRFTALTSSDVMSSSCCSLLMLFMSLFAFLSVCLSVLSLFILLLVSAHIDFVFLPFLLSSCFNSPQTRLTCVWFWPLTVYSVTLSSWVSCFFLLVKALCKISFQIKIFINKAYYASWYCKTDLTWL